MKNLFIIMFVLIITPPQWLKAQENNYWSTVLKITEGDFQDHHPVFAKHNGYSSLLGDKTMIAFDRTDGLGTNICVLECTIGGFLKDVKYITSGPGKNEYPTLARGDKKIMLVYQVKQNLGYNLFYCIMDSTGWSVPKPLTNDINNSNINPSISPLGLSDAFALSWEKNGHIYYSEYIANNWSEITDITQNDSLQNSNPVTFAMFANDAIVAWQRVKPGYPNYDRFDLLYAIKTNGVWSYAQISSDGSNTNPKIDFGLPSLTWQSTNNNRSIIKGIHDFWRTTVNCSIKTYFSDSLWNIIDYSGLSYILVWASPLLKSLDTNYFTDMASIAILSRDSLEQIKLTSPKDMIIINSGGEFQSPKIDGLGSNVWTVWESRQSGTWNLYGSTTVLYFPPNPYVNPFPNGFSLDQNFPNPFNPVTSIRYALIKETYVKLTIYNNFGQKIETLVDESQPVGYYSVNWTPKNLPSGIYYYRLQANKSFEAKKMLYLK